MTVVQDKGNITHVAILTGEVPQYRVPVYVALASAPGMAVTVICCRDSSDARWRDGPLKIKVTGCRQCGPFRWHRQFLSSVRASDVVLVMFDVHWLSCMLVAFFFPSKSLLWGHGLGRNKLGRALRLFLANRAAGVLLYEEGARSAFIEGGCRPERVFVVGNTVHVSSCPPAHEDRTRFLYVGRLQKRKRIDLLLRAFADAREELPATAGVSIVGDGPIRGELEALANELGISDRVEFAGAVFDDDVLARHYARAIAYVSPGDVGLGVLQAFGHGTPVVTGQSSSHGPEVENIIDGINGYVFDGGVDALREILIGMSRNTAETARMGENALHRYRNERTVNHMTRRMVKAIHVAAATGSSE